MRAMICAKVRLEVMSLVLVLLSANAGVVRAQFEACGDTLALVSPRGLEINFVESPVRGNQLWWPALSAEDASCFRTEVPAGLQAEVEPVVSGSYAEFNDRQIRLTASTGGQIGSKTQLSVKLALESSPPNPAVPSLAATMNLSGAGGIFLADIGANSVIQRNDGVPEHLVSVDVTAMTAVSVVGGGIRVYAAVTGVPVLRSDDGGQTWFEPLLGGESPIANQSVDIAVSPSNPDLVFLATPRDGLLRSDDGGQTWAAADAAIRDLSLTDRALLVAYLSVDVGGQLRDRLYLSLRGKGLFFSDDDATTWQRVDNLLVPAIVGGAVNCAAPATQPPDVESIVVSPTDSRTLYVGLRNWGVYRGTSAHDAWVPAFDGMVACQTGIQQGAAASVNSLVVTPDQVGGQDVLFAGTEFRGIFVSTDGAANWSDISQTAAYPIDADSLFVPVTALASDPTGTQAVVAAFDGAGLQRWSQVLGDWVPFDGAGGLTNPRIADLLLLPGTGTMLVASVGGGVYEPGDEIALSKVLASTGVDVGLSLRFDRRGVLNQGDSFDILAQTFQAYAVWRALSTNLVTGEPNWQMIGLYDLTNPEFCSFDPCDSPSQTILPGCFADKRANCFKVQSNNGELQWGFFDADVFNGFTYHYAVSTLDYGFAGNTAPRVFDGDFLFSPRHPSESNHQAALFLSVRPENWAYRVFETNVAVRTGLGDVFAVPNPLQRRGSWDLAPGQATVRFRNVSESSKIQIYTLAGDLVRELENVVTGGEERGNIEWDTRNGEGNEVASGVYIYRVTDATGAEFVSKVTIIR